MYYCNYHDDGPEVPTSDPEKDAPRNVLLVFETQEEYAEFIKNVDDYAKKFGRVNAKTLQTWADDWDNVVRYGE